RAEDEPIRSRTSISEGPGDRIICAGRDRDIKHEGWKEQSARAVVPARDASLKQDVHPSGPATVIPVPVFMKRGAASARLNVSLHHRLRWEGNDLEEVSSHITANPQELSSSAVLLALLRERLSPGVSSAMLLSSVGQAPSEKSHSAEVTARFPVF
ncbi:hypothetical protein P7K49_025959, partial [Saguinus oedipus]